VEGSRRFYSEVFGWEAQEPSPEFGGYFMFTRDGVPIAGGMGDMGDLFADNTWKIYLATDDIARTVKTAATGGAEILSPPMAVADLGSQGVLVDPTGAVVGVWQPNTFSGFNVLEANGAPSWFELRTRAHATAVDFYRTVFGWETKVMGDSDEFRYTVMLDPTGAGQLAGIMDAAPSLAAEVAPHWIVYWNVDDTDATIARVEALGGSVVTAAEDTPYGRLATVADPTGAYFKLHTPNP
jgi:hypothetical protein